ncbi:MAG: methyl-accepting chemotaxis protein [Pseudomonadota bacterium]|nr:methyl-accepting chemotaxis protein [Pseudomonadota bacterium]
MRNNQQITDNEYIIPKSITLVSKTDLNGTILECNDAFEAASGFSRNELIGKPHNLVRHPSVPEAVFADMWVSLKSGKPWSQVVKNRRADGGFYWVRANATPTYSNGKITGYMSVRSSVTEEEKRATAQAYQDIAEGRAKISRGRVITGVDWNRFNFFPRLNPQYQLVMLIGLLYLLPYLIYASLDGHNPVEIALVAIFGLIPPILYGLTKLKEDRQVRGYIRQLASGQPIQLDEYDQTSFNGKLKNALQSASLGAIERQEESAYQLDNANRLQTAIDQVSSNVMIADANLNIVYMNNAMSEFMHERESQLKTELPDLNADAILGANIDIFHKNPAHNRAMLDSIKEPTSAHIEVAGYHLELYVIPVYNRAGIKTSTLVEWRDKSADVQLLEQIGSAVKSAQEGLLDRRIDLSKVDGVAKELSLSFNELLETVERPINSAVEVAVSLSNGNLTNHIEGDYLGRFAVMQDSMNVAVDNLASMMMQTKSATTNVGEGAGQIKQGSLDLNDRTQNQAASLEQTASSMEQMTAAVRQNADNAQEAADVTHTTADQAKSGVKVMHSAIESMQQINESSQQINDIIGLIDSIAFQTNLLALNAAVEAARAGEHGRGFAVVAGEVRNLAGKSSEAAKDIRVLIEDTVKKVSEGTRHVRGSGDALNEIVESISNVNKIIENIATSSKEQSEGVDLVNQSITKIDSAVQQNAAMVEETAATAEELGVMAEMMTSNVNQFKVDAQSLGMETSLQTGNFDFATARRAHRQWRVKVRAYINEVDIKFDRNTADDGTKCALGQWIYGAGKQYQALPSYQTLEKSHSELHSFIGKILSLKDIGDIESANLEMAKLEQMSNNIISLISGLEKDINNGGAMLAQHAQLEKTAELPTASKPQSAPIKSAASKPTGQVKTATPVAKPANTAPATGLQTPPPSQPQGSDDEWAEF